MLRKEDICPFLAICKKKESCGKKHPIWSKKFKICAFNFKNSCRVKDCKMQHKSWEEIM